MLRGYWLILAAVAVAMAAVLVIAVVLPVNPCSPSLGSARRYQCHAEPIAEIVGLWSFWLIILGPLFIAKHEYAEVKSGRRSILGAWIGCIAGALASNLVALSVLMGSIAAGQRFGLFALFSGDAAFGVIALEAWAVLMLGLMAIVPPIVFRATRQSRDAALLQDWLQATKSAPAGTTVACPFCGLQISAAAVICSSCRRILRV